jgi:outer membrane lipoprotein carrier protein
MDGLAWVYAKPRNKDSSLSNVRVGLKGNTLVTLDIVDSFGQRSVLQFSAFETNPALDPGIFQFKPPAGVDVLRQ